MLQCRLTKSKCTLVDVKRSFMHFELPDHDEFFKFGGSNYMHIEPASKGLGGVDVECGQYVCSLSSCVSMGQVSCGSQNFIYIDALLGKLYAH